ncbi:MAG: hypothetical protein U9R26_05105, partial [Campylobacterota bacterium]|nr:hypothetical protein [Campylobacterota bacterium]
MYYIVNLDNQVVAADSDFLSLLKIDHLQGLFTQLINSKLKFNELGNGTLEIATGINTITLTQNRYPLTTLMGDLVLIELSEIKEAVPSPVDLPEATNDQVKFLVDEEEESDNDITPLPDEKIDFLKPIEEDSVEEEEILDLLPKEDIDDKI